LILLALLNLVR